MKKLLLLALIIFIYFKIKDGLEIDKKDDDCVLVIRLSKLNPFNWFKKNNI